MNNLAESLLLGVYEKLESQGLKGTDFCIAGGSVRDALMGKPPKDYDVFLFCNALPDKFHEIYQDVIISAHEYEKFLIKNTSIIALNGDTYPLQFIKIPSVNTPADVLNCFDWDISRFALYRDNPYNLKFLKKGNLPEKGNFLNLHKITQPLSTLFRGNRFCQRYEMKMKHLDIINLCQKVVDNTIRKDYSQEEVIEDE